MQPNPILRTKEFFFEVVHCYGTFLLVPEKDVKLDEGLFYSAPVCAALVSSELIKMSGSDTGYAIASSQRFRERARVRI